MKYLFLTAASLIFFIYSEGCSKKQSSEVQPNEVSEKVNAVNMEGWYTGNDKGDYIIGRSEGDFNGKPVFFIRSTGKVDSGYGTILKNIPPIDFLEKRIRLTGNIKVNSIYGQAGMWMRIDGGYGEKGIYGSPLSFDNMKNRLLSEPTDWKKYEIVLDVPKESRMLYYGMFLSGMGDVAISDFSIEAVGKEVPTTDTYN